MLLNPVKSRIVSPEILDSLPEDSPVAAKVRRDILRFNRLMGNFRWIADQFDAVAGPRPSVLELGPGTGELSAILWQRRPLMQYTGVDVCSRPADFPSHGQWMQTDLRKYIPDKPVDVLVANLILHQFNDEDIRSMAKRLIPRSEIVIVNELARHRRWVMLASMARILGMHPVSVSDAVISIRAGFRQRELVELLGLEASGRDIRITRNFFGAHRLLALRRSSES